ncbi:hypothetical protein [Neorhizobium galegae]|uniref:hypothetical protein n=1 Tax=Neorhizobium galegae TaxID=399 RepID=UPI001F33E5BF|nr:hypothetical protein [Neorhizobium galegae]UIK03501.1 hypothetical protein LZK81_12265 [Neorhizobium galegae]
MDTLSPVEKQRLLEILATARAEDWERFVFLTDQPFSNTASMKEQFEDTSRLMKGISGQMRPDVVVKVHEDGSRLIFAKIALDDPADNPILLTLHSTSERADAFISIWTFYQEMTFG